MDLVFSKDSVRNTTVSSLDGRPIYNISTSQTLENERTTITKSHHEMAVIELMNLYGAETCRVWGRDMVPKEAYGLTSVKYIFTASNGRRYTWKKGTLQDDYDREVASFERAHKGLLSGSPSSARLSIAHEELPIVDDIVSTFVMVEQQLRLAKQIKTGSEIVDNVMTVLGT